MNNIENDVIELLETVEMVYKNALEQFYGKLGIDDKIYSDLIKIPILIGETNSLEGIDSWAQYNPGEDQITINVNYLQSMKNYIDVESEEKKEKTRKNVILNLAVTLIHETIHASRRVAVPKNAIKIKNDIRSLVMNDMAQNFSEHNYSDASDILLPFHYDSALDEAELIQIREQKTLLEEAVTDVLANIIIYSYLPKNIGVTIEELIAKIIDKNKDYEFSPDANVYLYLGAKTISVMGLEGIAKFMTTRFNETEYEDLFYDIFKEDYHFFLEDIETIIGQKDFGMVDEATSEFHQIIEKYKKTR